MVPGFDLRVGDFPEALDDLAPGSVNLVVADPPWGDLDAWDHVGAFVPRVAGPGGVCVAYLGHRQCFGALDRLRRHLGAVRLAFLPSGGLEVDEDVSSIVAGSFVAILSNGRFQPATQWSNVVGGPIARPWHAFQRPLGNVRHYVEAFTQPGDLVVDPFLGGGTTAVACALLGRRFVGCDRDPTAIEATRARLRDLSGGALLRDR